MKVKSKFIEIKIFMIRNGLHLKELAWHSGVTSSKISQIQNGRCIPMAVELRKIVRGFEAMGYYECDLPTCLKPHVTVIQGEKCKSLSTV